MFFPITWLWDYCNVKIRISNQWPKWPNENVTHIHKHREDQHILKEEGDVHLKREEKTQMVMAT